MYMYMQFDLPDLSFLLFSCRKSLKQSLFLTLYHFIVCRKLLKCLGDSSEIDPLTDAILLEHGVDDSTFTQEVISLHLLVVRVAFPYALFCILPIITLTHKVLVDFSITEYNHMEIT